MDCCIIKKWLALLLFVFCIWTNAVSSTGEWGEWTSCSKPCGRGIQTRNGTCQDCIQRRVCNPNRCRDTTVMAWVVIGVTVGFLTILVIFLLWIFFIKPNSERKLSRKSSFDMLDSTPGTSRRTGTIDTNVDFKLSIIRNDGRGLVNSQQSLERRL